MRAIFTHLAGSKKGEADTFEEERILIGRALDNTLIFSDADRRVSAHHAEVICKDEQYIIRDLGSTNGTMVNGRRVMTTELRQDDLIEFGAGGPLARFGIEHDHTVATTEQVELPAELLRAYDTAWPEARTSGAMNRITASQKLARPRGRATNTRLIVLLVVAMVIGAAGGLALSSRLSSSRSFASIAERNSPAVVFIRVEFVLTDATGQPIVSDARTGTGFVVSREGLIVTNRHLIRDWEYSPSGLMMAGRTTKIEIMFPGNRREDAIVASEYRLSASKEIDVAILKINPPDDLIAVQAMETEPQRINQGDDVAVIGYPLGLDLLQLTGAQSINTSLFTGVVSRIDESVVQLNLRAYQGNSGGPVFSRQGRVIGILTANVGSAQDITLCTPIEQAIRLIDSSGGFSISR